MTVRVLLLMTRIGAVSTRRDIFRTHPATRIEPTVAVWEASGHARTGLSGGVLRRRSRRAVALIEVEHGKGATIAEIPQADLSVVGAAWALEKASP